MNDIEQAHTVYSNKIKNISKKHGQYVFQSVTWTLIYTVIRSERWTSRQLFISRITRACRQPTAWNSFVSERLNDINESKLMDFPKCLLQLITCEYLELPKGSRWKLTEFIASHQETLQHDFAQLMEAHKFNHVT